MPVAALYCTCPPDTSFDFLGSLSCTYNERSPHRPRHQSLPPLLDDHAARRAPPPSPPRRLRSVRVRSIQCAHHNHHRERVFLPQAHRHRCGGGRRRQRVRPNQDLPALRRSRPRSLRRARHDAPHPRRDHGGPRAARLHHEAVVVPPPCRRTSSGGGVRPLRLRHRVVALHPPPGRHAPPRKYRRG